MTLGFGIWYVIQCQSYFKYSLEVNTRITVQAHCCVTIPCAFTANYQKSFTNSSGYWKTKKHDQKIIVASTNTSIKGFKPNFLITGDPNKGDCTLTITDVKKEDSGMYYFRFEGPVKYNYQAKSITVNVTDPPKKPEVVITSADGGLVDTNDTVLLKEEKSLTLNCSAGSNIPSNVTWIKGNFSSQWSTITITPSEADTYRCLVQDEHGYQEKQLHIKSEVTNAKDKALVYECSPRVLDMLIGLICGMVIVILFLLASKLIARKYFKMDLCLFVHMDRDRNEALPMKDTEKDDPSDLYMNVNGPRLIAKTLERSNEQRDSNSIPDDKEDIHYSSIVLSNQPSGVLSRERESEYAEIVTGLGLDS
ncbi:uncharacterized protein [Pyxicephalus adspersus]|uniref:uncharacterized protein isoform X2 n=1 Tax=Pyxicephalus adspersus TaxID=30357 RepID=UPI003B5C498D